MLRGSRKRFRFSNEIAKGGPQEQDAIEKILKSDTFREWNMDSEKTWFPKIVEDSGFSFLGFWIFLTFAVGYIRFLQDLLATLMIHQE